MSRRKSFVYDMYPQDFNDGVKGFSDATIGIYIRLINLMRVEGGPLPPRRLTLSCDEFDEWIRDKLNMKNVRTWRKAKAELLADPDKLVLLPDGRVANPRTERDVAAQRPSGRAKEPADDDDDDDDSGEGGAGGQGGLRLVGGSVGNPVDSPVNAPGKAAQSTEVPAKIGGSSAKHRAMRAYKPLKSNDFRCVSPYPCIPVSLMMLQLPSLVAPRARGDPFGCRA